MLRCWHTSIESASQLKCNVSMRASAYKTSWHKVWKCSGNIQPHPAVPLILVRSVACLPGALHRVYGWSGLVYSPSIACPIRCYFAAVTSFSVALAFSPARQFHHYRRTHTQCRRALTQQ